MSGQVEVVGGGVPGVAAIADQHDRTEMGGQRCEQRRQLSGQLGGAGPPGSVQVGLGRPVRVELQPRRRLSRRSPARTGAKTAFGFGVMRLLRTPVNG